VKSISGSASRPISPSTVGVATAQISSMPDAAKMRLVGDQLQLVSLR